MMNMLPHIAKSNQIKRVDQITALLMEICVENPIKIDVNRISQSINTINLSWILAICATGYDLIGKVDFKNTTLGSLQWNLLKNLHNALGIENQLKSKPMWFDETDLATGSTITKTLGYFVPHELIRSTLLSHPQFNIYLYSSREDAHQHACESEKRKTDSSEQKSRKAPLKRQLLENFVKRLVHSGTCTTFGQFEDEMIRLYFNAITEKKIHTDLITYNDDPDLTSVYCFIDEKGKYRISLTPVNPDGRSTARKPFTRALSSFEDIYRAVLK